MRPTIRFARDKRGPAVALAIAFATVACDGGRATAEGTIFSFAEAVQREDLDALFCALAGAVDPAGGPDDVAARKLAFDAWARARLKAYAEGRERGAVDLEDDGIVLVKAFALAKGTYFDVSRALRSGDSLTAVTEIRFAYDDVDVSGFPPGTTLYLCGTPPGRIERVRIPAGGGRVDAEVLDTIDVQWTLRREPPAGPCGERWTVASATPVRGTATTREIGWVF